jgi:hypothetical protein
MAKEPDRADGRPLLIQRLVQETGISEAQASELIAFVGVDWSSLVREARILKPKR